MKLLNVLASRNIHQALAWQPRDALRLVSGISRGCARPDDLPLEMLVNVCLDPDFQFMLSHVSVLGTLALIHDLKRLHMLRIWDGMTCRSNWLF